MTEYFLHNMDSNSQVAITQINQVICTCTVYVCTQWIFDFCQVNKLG